MFKKQKAAAGRLQKIIDLQSALISLQFDLPAFMNIAVVRMQDLTNASGAVIEIVDGDAMVYQAASGTLESFLGLRIKKSGSLSGLCVQTSEILISKDTSRDARVNYELCKKVGAHSMIVVPLMRFHETIGVLKVVSTRINSFNAENIETLQLIAGVLGAALGQQVEVDASRQREVKLTQMAHSDALTSLPNRALFTDRLTHAIRRIPRNKKHMALMYIDIDHFKNINDTYGHLTGDALLKEFALRASATIRNTDTLARLGGDEFALIAEGLTDMQDANILADKIVSAMRKDVKTDAGVIPVSISVGVAVSINPEIDPVTWIHEADTALYEAKKAGRNGYRLRVI